MEEPFSQASLCGSIGFSQRDIYVRLIVHGDEKLLIPDEINLHIKAFQLAVRFPCIIKSMTLFPTKIT